MVYPLLFVALCIGVSQLTLSGLDHVARPSRLVTAVFLHPLMNARDFGSERLARPAAVVFGLVELGLAAGASAGYLAGQRLLTTICAVGICSLGVAFVAWIFVLLARGADTPCGCRHEDAPANVGTVIRSGLVAGAGGVGVAIAVTSGVDPIWSADAPAIALGLAAGAVLSTITALLPDSLEVPRALPSRDHIRLPLGSAAT